MNNYGAEIKVGLFVVIGIIILSYMSLKVGKFDVGRKKGYSIAAYFDNVSGLNKDVPVEIAGIEIGSVGDIRLDKKRARVTMRIYPDISIPSDSKASIRTKGIMGDKFIEITPGKEELPPLEDGETIVNTYSPTDIDKLVTTIGDVLPDETNILFSATSINGNADSIFMSYAIGNSGPEHPFINGNSIEIANIIIPEPGIISILCLLAFAYISRKK